jgi:Zn-dependent protease with chaperone function
METTLYPQSPVGVPADFTKPGKSYRKQVWVASAGIISFVLLYVGLSTWFLYKSYKLFGNTFSGGRDGVLSFIAAVFTGFLGVFMIKAIFFITKRDKTEALEIKPKDEPRLFEFIYRIADEAKAPRPHRVFVSGRVNASVFYDVSFINLFFPTRKNLEIGLGLVNTLNLGEFKSILAHEFGHFTQRSMIIGRWVYIAHRVAYEIVGKRDGFDEFLRTLSSLDFRIAWIGWLLSVLIWSIRAVSETFFKMVVITERALSREMEFNADLVAVSLTGSDALIHSLHKLHAADEAYDEAIQFVNKQLGENKRVSDIFVIQENSIKHMSRVLNNPAYGVTPEINEADRSKFRVFKEQIAQPPKMWSTHPSNTDREKNAKAVYIASEEDRRSSWILFSHADDLKQQVTQVLYRNLKIETTPLSNQEALEKHNKEFQRSFLLPAYRGIYFDRPITIAYKTVGDMYDHHTDPQSLFAQWNKLYPASLQQDLERMKNLDEELAMLEGLNRKELDAGDEKINYRGREIGRKDLPETIEQTKEEAKKARRLIEDYDQFCRNIHLAAAKAIGGGWQEYLVSVATLVHFCEHGQKNIEVLNRHYLETLSVVSKIRNISSSELLPLIRAANDLHDCLDAIFAKREQIRLRGRLLEKMNGKQLDDLLEPFRLGIADSENINSWISAAQSWVNLAYNSLQTLKEASLDELLHAEACIERFYKEPSALETAPEPQVTPDSYPKFDPKVTRDVSRKIDLFSRFYNADGIWPTVGRLASAAAIIIFVIIFSFSLGRSAVVIYNGLPVDVIVDFAGKKTLVPHGDHDQIEVDEFGKSFVNTTTTDGKEVERFEVDVSDDSKSYIYNVASAAIIYQSYVYYGYNGVPVNDKPLLLGAQRWFTQTADYYFEDPPQSISLKAGSTDIRTVMTVYLANPQMQAYSLQDSTQQLDFVRAHALWEDPKSADILSWLSLAAQTSSAREVLKKRLNMYPDEMASLRELQDLEEGAGKRVLCEEFRRKYQKDPKNPDLYYLQCRCIDNEDEKDRAFVEGNKTWPGNKWLAYASAFCYVQQEDWEKALDNFKLIMNTAPELMPGVEEEMKRICHLLRKDELAASFNGTSYLAYVNAVEQSTEQNDPNHLFAFKLLLEGKTAEALERSKEDSSVYHDILPLVAVSDGVGAGVIQQLMSAPLDQNLSRPNLIPLIALSIKHKLSLEPFRSSIKSLTSGKDTAFFNFTGFLQQGNVAAAEEFIASMTSEMKGKCSLLGILVMGSKAPYRWHVLASGLLFNNEKPYRKAELKGLEANGN